MNKFDKKTLEVFIFRMENILAEEVCHVLTTLISKDKNERIDKIKHRLSAQHVLLGDSLARYAICKCFNLQNSELSFDTNEYGKPFIKNYQDIEYNISHAGNYVVCVIGKVVSGIDVEEIKNIEMKIAERFFSKSEYIKLNALPTEIQKSYFYSIWTMKESYIKMKGRGLHIPLNSFDVFNEEQYCKCFFYEIFQNHEAVCHVCSEDNIRIKYQYVKLFELVSFAQNLNAIQLM